MARPTTSMKEGWLCRTSCDEKNHEVEPMMMTQWWSRSSDDLDPVMMIQQWWSKSSDDLDPFMMIQQWWSRSSDDLDPVVMIQIQWWSRSSDDVQWWSRSSDDPNPVMMSHDDPDREMIQIRIWRWLEDSEDLRCRWRDDLANTEKKTSTENCVERVPS